MLLHLRHRRYTRHEQDGNTTRSAGSEQVHSTHCLDKKGSGLDEWVTFLQEITSPSMLGYRMWPAHVAKNSDIPLFRLWFLRSNRCLSCFKVLILIWKLFNTRLTNSTEQNHSWETQVLSYSRYYPHFFGIRRFITAFTNTCHLFLSHTSSTDASPSHFLKIHFNIIPHLRLGLPSGLLPSSLLTKTLYVSLFLPYVPLAPPISFLIWLPE
jgi:hypothetical protein